MGHEIMTFALIKEGTRRRAQGGWRERRERVKARKRKTSNAECGSSQREGRDERSGETGIAEWEWGTEEAEEAIGMNDIR